MRPFLQDADFTLYAGDAAEVLVEVPAESVHMCVTSPPFFGLRDYGNEGQIGLEATPEEWVARLVAVFDEVKRVLRLDGTLWVECGDSYATGQFTRQGKPRNVPQAANGYAGEDWTADRSEAYSAHGFDVSGLKQKDLIGQPFLLAFALREAGWYWRNVCIWHKPNPMPESVRDRFTVSHSYVLLFSKSPRYFFDAEAVREDYSGPPEFRYGRVGAYQNLAMNGEGDGTTPTSIRGPDGRRATAVKAGDNSIQHRDGERWPNSGRNARSVWTIPTEPLPFEHYAAFPQALAERCIKAGSSPGDMVLDPFLGSGTSALVARRLNRRCIGIELNADYCALAARRTQQLSLEAP